MTILYLINRQDVNINIDYLADTPLYHKHWVGRLVGILSYFVKQIQQQILGFWKKERLYVTMGHFLKAQTY